MGGFSHDFKSLDGDYCTVTAAFYALRTPGRNRISDHIFRLTSRFPMLRRIPTAKNRIIRDFRRLLSRIAAEELERIDSGKTATSDGTIIASLGTFQPIFSCTMFLASHLNTSQIARGEPRRRIAVIFC
jgi:hypothetical protein